MSKEAVATRQVKKLDPWKGRSFGSYTKSPRFLHPAFLEGLTPKHYLVLETLFILWCGATVDGPIRVPRDKLFRLSGLGSPAAITVAVKNLKMLDYLTEDSRAGHYDISPLLDLLESKWEDFSRRRVLDNLTLSGLAQKSVNLTKKAASGAPTH